MQILDVLQGKNTADKDTSRATAFHELLKSDLPPSELSVDRLQNEAAGIVGAGIETTKGTLSGACFHILDNPPILARLRQELIEAIPDPQNPPPLDSLMQLPYLSACIEEGLCLNYSQSIFEFANIIPHVAIRLSYGTVQRSPRVSHHAPFIYGTWTIPPGVPVSMDTSSLHHNERTFPDSYAYKPERWLGNPKGPDGKKFLSRYMTAFGRGTRICIGMHLAYAQIYIGLAALFRRFELELFETDRTAVDFYGDFLVPVPKPGTLGVRVLVK
jgi:cytochrome P450